LRWPTSKRDRVIKDHKEVIGLDVSELLSHWEIAGVEPTSRASFAGVWNVFARADNGRLFFINLTDREVRVNTERKTIMYTVYDPTDAWRDKRIQAGERQKVWKYRGKG
jgi:hypothetical protein